MKLTKYYTFGEWWKFVSSYPDWSINTSPMGFKDSGDIITSFMGAISTFSGSVYTGARKVFYDQFSFFEYKEGEPNYYELNEKAVKVLQFSLGRFYDEFVMNIDVYNPTQDMTSLLYKHSSKVFNTLLAILESTYPSYSALIDNYESLIDKLIKPKENVFASGTESSGSGVNKFNDTPQYTGSYDSYEFTTNINQSETTATSETNSTNKNDDLYNVEKLALLQDKLRNVYLDWSNEFKRMFTLEVNLYE